MHCNDLVERIWHLLMHLLPCACRLVSARLRARAWRRLDGGSFARTCSTDMFVQ